MKARISRHTIFLLCCVLLVSGSQIVAQQQENSGTPLTNASVVKLVKAGFQDKTVIAIIHNRPSRFELSPDRLVELKKSGVSEKVILAMLSREGATTLIASDGWEDDAFFNDGVGLSNSRQPGPKSDPNEMNIFGESGGSRGRTRSRGLNGSNDGETQTTGSATVRIIRPPTEAGGGGTPKLEKTPTLTNDSIVELVEAGFSEGTIIRRIEQSPADYDLAPPKLADLRRRRVSEPVIAAMTAVMSDDTGPSATPNR